MKTRPQESTPASTDNGASHLPPALRAMADQTRLRILLMLEARGRTVGEIVDFFDLSQPTITRHLQTLLAAGLVARTKRGQRVTYVLAEEMVQSFCCQLVACFPCCSVTVTPRGKEISITSTKKITGRKTSSHHSPLKRRQATAGTLARKRRKE